MVAGAWRRFQRIISFHNVPVQQFSACLWQKGQRPTITYLCYRWLLALTLLIVAIASFANQTARLRPTQPGEAPKEVPFSYWKWFIYLTNWGFMLCITQALLALTLVQTSYNAKSFVLDNITGEGEPRDIPLLCRIYWATHTAATDLAFTITLVYWAMVHDPEIHRLDIINLFTHAGNSLVMLIELVITSHPFRPGHAIIPVTFGTIYALFSFIYYICGGTDRVGTSTIYPQLNWQKPEQALIFVIVCACLISAAHLFAWILVVIRNRIMQRKSQSGQPTLSKSVILTMED